MSARPFFYKLTHAVRVTVRPSYLADQSQPMLRRYVFVYFVRIEYIGRQTIQLLSRRWHIYDSIGEEYEVAGEGVVGEQPVFGPGDVHEYQSYCILKSPRGYMEGHYHFSVDDGSTFNALIPRFLLESDEAPQTR